MKHKHSSGYVFAVLEFLKKNYGLFNVAVVVCAIVAVFFVSRGAIPHLSELSYIENSSVGGNIGSVIPASCDSGQTHRGTETCNFLTSFTADSTSVPYNGSTGLHWKVTTITNPTNSATRGLTVGQLTSCRASGGWSGDKLSQMYKWIQGWADGQSFIFAMQGDGNTGSLISTVVDTLTCTMLFNDGLSQTQSRSVTINVASCGPDNGVPTQNRPSGSDGSPLCSSGTASTPYLQCSDDEGDTWDCTYSQAPQWKYQTVNIDGWIWTCGSSVCSAPYIAAAQSCPAGQTGTPPNCVNICVPTSGQACLAYNSCGDSNTGTYSCQGVCSASAPGERLLYSLFGICVVPPICPSGFSGTPPNCVPGGGGGGSCANGAVNPPACTTCANGATNPPTCTVTGGGSCTNGAVNPPACTTCGNGAANPPTCTVSGAGSCVNGGTNPPSCTAQTCSDGSVVNLTDPSCHKTNECGTTLGQYSCGVSTRVCSAPEPDCLRVSIENFTAEPTKAVSGNTYLLSWSSSGADSCLITGTLNGAQTENVTAGTSGSHTTVRLRSDTTSTATYTLTCSNPRYSDTRSLNVQVLSPTIREF